MRCAWHFACVRLRHEDRTEDSRLALAAAGRCCLTLERGSPAERAPADSRARWCPRAGGVVCRAHGVPRARGRIPCRAGPSARSARIGCAGQCAAPDIVPGRLRSRGGRRRSQASAGVSWGGDRVQAAADRDDADRARRQPHAGGAGAGAAADVLAAPHAGVRRPGACGRCAATAGGRAAGHGAGATTLDGRLGPGASCEPAVHVMGSRYGGPETEGGEQAQWTRVPGDRGRLVNGAAEPVSQRGPWDATTTPVVTRARRVIPGRRMLVRRIPVLGGPVHHAVERRRP